MLIQEVTFESSLIAEKDLTFEPINPAMKGKKYAFNANWKNKKNRKYKLYR